MKLPFPPSSNHYWFRNGNRTFIGKKGLTFRQQVKNIVAEGNIIPFNNEKLKVDILVKMPDKRKRDIDNLLKALLDALQHAGVYDDDFNINDVRIRKDDEIVKGGEIIIEIEAIL